MASVTSLDKDLRNMRLSKYTPQAANEAREWIEDILHEKLPSRDLIAALKDGVALCRLVNLAVSPGVKYKQSSMPFVQMENISHFLRACQMPPLSLPPHDVFLTVDLYESKDPAQVLQCLGAFSRRANAIQPGKFPRTIGAKSKGGVMSPQLTGSSQGGYIAPSATRGRGVSNVSESNSGALSPAARSTISGRSSPGKPSSPSPKAAVSSWSKRSDEEVTAPAWNIHQYGYMGGASQANQGVAFGARRQITTPSPAVPSFAEKEKRRREAEAEDARRRRQAEEEEHQRRIQREEEEARAKAEEERRWAEETERLREKERREVEEQKRKWDEEQRRWEDEEQRRLQEEKEVEEKFERERQRKRGLSDARLNGQFLSQYQANQVKSPTSPTESSAESQRIRELEQALELAKERENQYERERQDLREKQARKNRSRSRSRPRPVQPSYDLSSLEEERRLLRSEWQNHRNDPSTATSPPPKPPRPLPDPKAAPQVAPKSPRPLPDPTAYANRPRESRTDRFLASNPAPAAPQPASHRPQDYSSTAEIDAENSRRMAAQQKTRAGGWASKSLLEREMERERERQREWEESQQQTREAAKRGLKDDVGLGPGEGAWDVHQYGFMGGDSQNRGGPGLGVGGARRQIIGPRPPP